MAQGYGLTWAIPLGELLRVELSKGKTGKEYRRAVLCYMGGELKCDLVEGVTMAAAVPVAGVPGAFGGHVEAGWQGSQRFVLDSFVPRK